ncbi:hypothetical protein UNSWDHB_1585 [Dehalobacter sp. UNSWDHB]|nr:hypothetical protein DHBDCA_p2379 [Dehalobacter sp. DCA]AFV06393.1 hypothetical protein DCF50_p2390 [Dehalobacter sp. CF]EQB21094.1 hypothetical protein UNSWDHB_1585 [Dehalobacter sp. UNSWDHB]
MTTANGSYITFVFVGGIRELERDVSVLFFMRHKWLLTGR